MALEDDAERLAALRGLGLLDTEPESGFDDLVLLASQVCDTPMAAISLVDDRRQWFKSRRGFSAVETPRADAFCTHTIEQRDVLEVPDAWADARFLASPLVTGEMGVRFYAAAPLVTPDGHAIGTLCVMDRRPRQLDREQRAALHALAGQAMAQIVLREHMKLTERLERRFRALVERSADLIVLVDAVGAVVYISPAARETLGYEPDDARLGRLDELVDSPSQRRQVMSAWSLAPGATLHIPELEVRRPDGTHAHLEVRASNLLADEAVQAVVFNCRDITHRRRAEMELERTREQAVTVLETANDAYIQIDAAGRVCEWNRRAVQLFGWEREEALGELLSDLIVPPEYRDAHTGGVGRAGREAETTSEPIFDALEVSAIRKDGRSLPVEVTMWPTTSRDGERRFSAFVRDISARREMERQMAHMSLHDALTGLPNRHLLDDRLQTALARAAHEGHLVGVLFCDVDRLKIVNDSSGHSIGDQVLVEIAGRLSSTVRSMDTVARFGGDEFVVLVDGVDDPLEVSVLAERLRTCAAGPIRVGGVDIPTSLSIGVAVGDGAVGAERLLGDADGAMYLAKERGRDRIETFGADLHARVRARLEDERALRVAIEQDEFTVHYQPIIAIHTGQIVGAEALIRWERPGSAVRLPGDFIDLAEETDAIVEIGSVVLDRACAQMRRWQEEFARPDLSVAVNVSARQVANTGLVAAVEASLRASGLHPRTLTIELTESTLMQDLACSATTLEQLRGLGVGIALDDFGTGYSSLAYLKALPIDALKIDRSFIANVGRDPSDAAIVAAIVSLAGSLDLRVVAEGVEEEHQLEYLRSRGCGYAQGYHFAAPLPAEGFARLLRPTVSTAASASAGTSPAAGRRRSR